MLGQDEDRRGIARNVAESVRSRFGYQHWLSCLRARLKGSDGSLHIIANWRSLTSTGAIDWSIGGPKNRRRANVTTQCSGT
jgi:hypothetical protein